MPVSEISGVAGTLAGNSDPGGLKEFAEHLAAARDRDKQSALQELQFMMDMTNKSGGQFTPDPKELQKIAKRAGLGGMVGPGGTNDMFTALADTAKKQASRQEEEFATSQAQKKAATEASEASTAASKADTARIIQQTGFDKSNQALTQTVNDAKTRLAANDYSGPNGDAQRKADAMSVAIHEKLTPDMMERLGMSKDEMKSFDDQVAQQRKLSLQTAQMGLLNAASGYTIKDPKTGKERALTTDELNGMMTGKMPAGLQTPQMQELHFRAITAGADMMRAQAELDRARAEGKLTDAQIKKYNAESEKDLAQADAFRKKGVKTGYDDLLKTIDALRTQAGKGEKPAKALMEEAEKQLAAYFGGTPDESKDWLGRMQLRGFNFEGANEPEGKVSDANAKAGVPDQGLGFRLGKVLNPVGIQKGIESTERDITEGLINFGRGMVGYETPLPQEQPLTDDQLKALVK